MYKHDDDLVIKAVCGSKEAINELLEIYYPDICRFAASKIGKQEGEEVAQKSVVHIIEGIHKLRDVSKFQSWMMSIVFHGCIEYIRKYRCFTKLFINTEVLEKRAVENRMSLPEECIVDEERRTSMVKVLSELPNKYVECIHMYYYKGMHYKDIAKVLGITHAMVRNNLYRGRVKLRKILKESGIGIRAH